MKSLIFHYLRSPARHFSTDAGPWYSLFAPRDELEWLQPLYKSQVSGHFTGDRLYACTLERCRLISGITPDLVRARKHRTHWKAK